MPLPGMMILIDKVKKFFVTVKLVKTTITLHKKALLAAGFSMLV